VQETVHDHYSSRFTSQNLVCGNLWVTVAASRFVIFYIYGQSSCTYRSLKMS